jgi:hypothetical protein
MRLIDIQKMAVHALGKNKIQTALTMLESSSAFRP